MEENKTINDELEGQKWTSLLIGYVFVLAAMFVAFEWTQRDVVIEDTGEEPVFIAQEEDMIPVTQQQQQMAPPPAAAPKVAELINIVDDNTDLPEEEVQTTEEVNQAIVAVTGNGAPTAVVAAGPPAAVVEEVEDETIYEVVGQPAEFPGDYVAWLQKNLKYPSRAAEQGVQGRVQVRFIVEKDGSIKQATCLRNSTGDKDIEKEALRVVNAMPKWRPAKQGSKTVRSYFVLPITFRLN